MLHSIESHRPETNLTTARFPEYAQGVVIEVI
jgi:hypothetical protein